MRNILNVFANFGNAAGISSSAEKIAVYLEKLGYDIRTIRLNKSDLRYLTPEGRKLYQKPFQSGKVGIAFGYPTVFSSLFNKVKIGHTVFETTKIPKGWDERCNKLDRIIVPSNFCKELFLNSGVSVPIDVVPLGIDTETYRIWRRESKQTFTFLMSGKLTIRKNPGAVIAAFLALFQDNPKVRLILKTMSGTLAHFQLPYKNIIIVDRITNEKEMINLYKNADCFVFPSKGEGFGLPPLEAMATGLPTIFPNHTGMKDYADERYNYTIKKYKMSPVQRYPAEFGDCGEWFESDFGELKELMWHVYKHQDEAREKGKQAMLWVREKYNYRKVAEKIDNILKKYDDTN